MIENLFRPGIGPISMGMMGGNSAVLGGADWWRGPWPSSPGVPPIPCTNVWAYRAINSVGTIWPGGPTAYVQSLVNLENPGTNDLTAPAGNPAWAAATGWQFVAAQLRYLDTGLVPANDQSWSALGDYVMLAAMDGQLFGARSGPVAQQFGAIPAWGTNRRYYYNGGQIALIPGDLAGNIGIVGNQGYLDGAADGGAIPAWGGASTNSIFIGARSGLIDRFITANVHAMWIADCTITAPQALALATAMSEL